LFNISQNLLFVVALSLDAFAVALSYGASKIKISFFSSVTISLICSISLGAAIVLSSIIFLLLPLANSVVMGLGASLIILVGIFKLYDNLIKDFLKKNNFTKVSFRKKNSSKTLLRIYIEPTKADLDYSKSLSIGEAVVLSIILSLDSFVAGLGLGQISGSNLLLLIILSFIVCGGFLILGSSFGRILKKKIKLDLSWLSGLVLIGIGLFSLV